MYVRVEVVKGDRKSWIWVPAMAATFSALVVMSVKCLRNISAVNVWAGSTERVILGLDLSNKQVFAK